MPDHADGSGSATAGSAGRREVRLVLLILLALAVFAAIYGWYAWRKLDSLVTRDLRGLSTLTSQIESEMTRLQETVRLFAQADPAPAPISGPTPSADVFQDFMYLRADGGANPAAAIHTDTVEQDLLITGTRPRVQITYTVFDASENTSRRASGVVDLENIVRPLFAQPFLGIFDVVMLATPDGKVLHQTTTTQATPLPTLLSGRRGEVPRRLPATGAIVTDLGALEERSGFQSWTALHVRALRGASRRTEVRLMDTEYYLFSQPARFVTDERALQAAAEPAKSEEAKAQEDQREIPAADLLVCALVPKRKFRLEALSISDSVLAIAAGVLLLLLCWYPYVRISMLPKRAPLRPVDVVLAVLGALFGSAVLTIIIFDTALFRRFSTSENNQLRDYAEKLSEDLLRDMLRSVRLAEAMQQSSEPVRLRPPNGGLIDNLEKSIDWNKREIWQYPYFRGYVWLDKDGRSIVRAVTDGIAPPHTSMAREPFFQDARDRRWWTLVERPQKKGTVQPPDIPHRYVVELTRGRGAPEAIIAVPHNSHVFAIYVPLIHFVDPVVPPGFGFAIIDDNGTVLFHSDKHRALNENFFKETDDNRTLRAAMYARRATKVNGRYWGTDHQLYVVPIAGTPWTAVAMRDEALLRTINTEALAMTALLIALYGSIYAVGFIVLAITRPSYRAPWLWPTTGRRTHYLKTMLVLLVEVAAFVACIFTIAPPDLLAIAFVAPVRALTTAFLIVNGYERGSRWLWGFAVSAVMTLLWCIVVVGADVDRIVVSTAFVQSALLTLIAFPFVLSLGLGKAARSLARFAPRWIDPVSGRGVRLATVVLQALVLIVLLLIATKAGGGLERNGPLLLLGLCALGLIVAVGLTCLARREVAERSTMTLYRSVGFCMLVASALLPALTFLKISMRLGVEARVKYAQLRLADMLEKRVNFIEEANVRPQRIASDCNVVPHVFESAWTLVPRSPWQRLSENGPRQRRPVAMTYVPPWGDDKNIQGPWVPPLIARLLPRYSESSIATRDLHFDNASDRTWQWWRRPSDITLLRDATIGQVAMDRLYARHETPKLLIRSAMPMRSLRDPWFPPSPKAATFRDQLNCKPEPDADAGAVVGAQLPDDPRLRRRPVPFRKIVAAALLLLIGVMVGWMPLQAVGFIGKRVFLFGIGEPPWLPADGKLKAPLGRHIFVEGAQSSDLIDESQFSPLDLTEGLQQKKTWRALLAEADKVPPGRDILITNFEAAFNDRQFSFGVLGFLEELLRSARRSVVIFSPVTMRTILATQSGSLRERWSRVFDEFTRVEESVLRSQFEPPPEYNETTQREFERIWRDSSPEERLAMYHVARDGLLNGKDRDVVQRLFARRLIRRSPELELWNPALEQFVLTAGKRDAVTEVESASTPPRWQTLKVATGMFVALTVLLLLLTQQELFNATIGTITALAAGIPAILKLIAIIQGPKAESE